jgi:dihydroorotase
MLDRHELRSKAKNSPFHEAKFQGRVIRTLVAGETVFQFTR